MEPEVTVREIMTREYVGVSEGDAVGDAVELMLDAGTVPVVVLRGADPVGMLTPGDALSLLAGGGSVGTAVADVMSGTVPTVEASAPMATAAGELADAGLEALLVTEDEELVGVVSERDVVRATATVADHAALSPSAAEAGAVAGEKRAATATADAMDAAGGGAGDTEYSTQGVCEICGALAHELAAFNGQLICADCREV